MSKSAMQAEILTRAVVNRILAHAQQSPEAEICGLVSARDGIPYRVYPVSNAAKDPARRFTMDPHEQIEAFRRIRDAGETLFAIYHSHPDSPAIPSALDQMESAYPEALYLLVSLNTCGVLELAAFRWNNTTAIPIDLVVE